MTTRVRLTNILKATTVHLPTLKMVMSNYDYSETDHKGFNILMIACQFRSEPEIFKLLLDAGASRYINYRSDGGWTALMYACQFRSEPEVFKLLLDAGADKFINQTDKDGWNALMIATRSISKPEIFKLLLDAGASKYLNQTSKGGWNALMFACQYRSEPEIFKLLLDAGADKYISQTNKDRFNALMIATHFISEPKIYKLLLDAGASKYLHQTTNAGWNALMFACQFISEPEIFKLLLDAGADKHIKQTEMNGWNALMLACQLRSEPEIFKLLLDTGASKYLHQTSKSGWNALMLACRHQLKPEIFKLFLDAGADQYIKQENIDGDNAFTIGLKYIKAQNIIDTIFNINPEYHMQVLTTMLEHRKIVPSLVQKWVPLPLVVKSTKRVNAYTVLGVEKDASDKEIKKQYVTLRRRLRNNSASISSLSGEDDFIKTIGQAYNTLKDPSRRRSYDEKIEMPRQEILKHLSQICYNLSDPISLQDFKKLSLDDLRRVLVVFESHYGKAMDAKGHCFEEDTLQALAQKGKWENPLTRKQLPVDLKKVLQL